MTRALTLAVALSVAFAQESELPVFRTETALVTVGFHVIQKNRYVQTLRPGDIEILENGTPQKIAFFEGGDYAPRRVPVDMILLFDVSGSVTQAGLLDAVVFKRDLLDGLPIVSLGVYAFDSRLWRLTRLTRDLGQLKFAFDLVEHPERRRKSGVRSVPLKPPPGRKGGRPGTNLYEAVIETARDLAQGQPNHSRMMVVFSDGFGTTDARPEDALKVLNPLGITVHPVILGHQPLVERIKEAVRAVNASGGKNPGARDRLSRLEMQEQEVQDFASLGERTGGRAFDPMIFNDSTVKQIIQGLVGYVQTEYVAGYTPQSTGGKRSYKVQVRLKNKSLGKLSGGFRTVIH